MSRPVPYEFGAEKFKDAEGLCTILARGYFREGSAWGSVRCGWREVVPWARVREVLRRECPGNWMEATNSAGGPGWRFNGPVVVAQGAGSEEGRRLWIQGAGSSFSKAVGALWAEIDASEMDQFTAAPKVKVKKKIKLNSGLKKETLSEPDRPRNPRRL